MVVRVLIPVTKGVLAPPLFMLGLAVTLLLMKVGVVKVGMLLPKVVIKGSLPSNAFAKEYIFWCVDLFEEMVNIISFDSV